MKKPKEPLAVRVKNFFRLSVIVIYNIVRLPLFIIYLAACWFLFFDFIAYRIRRGISAARGGRNKISGSTEKIKGE